MINITSYQTDMTLQVLFSEGNNIPQIPNKLFEDYPNIKIDPKIQGGWPHIKGTRIVATDIFRAQVAGNSLQKMIMEFREMGSTVTEEQLEEAFRFTLAWLSYTINDGEKTQQTSK